MKKTIAITMTCVMTLALFGCTVVEETPATSAEQSEEQGEIRAQDDFYGYINGESLRNAEFEYGYSAAGSSFDEGLVNKNVNEIIDEVIAGSDYEAGSEEYLIKTAYDMYLEFEKKTPELPDDIARLTGDIKNISTLEEFFEVDAGLYKDYGVTNVLNMANRVNYARPGETDPFFMNYHGLLGVDFSRLETTYTVLDGVKRTGSSAMQYLGYEKSEADMYGEELAYLVMDIYNATDMDISEDATSLGEVFEMSYDETKSVFSNVPFDLYLSGMGYDLSKCKYFCAMDRGQLEGLNNIFVEENLNALKAWEIVKLIDEYSLFMAPTSDLLVDYMTYDYRTAEEKAKDFIINVLYCETDPLYVERCYTDEMDESIRAICDDIKSGYRELIRNADWLTEDTRASLLTKLENITYLTGKDVVRHNNEEYKDIPGRNIYEFYRNYSAHNTKKNTEKAGNHADATVSDVPMQMVNACYDPAYNNITITVAIVNAPFFDINADYYTNLGGIGFTIAHEMGHAFDNNCILFDSNGKYDPEWIDQKDVEELEERNQVAIRYFEENFTVFDIYHIDGEKTLGENYADLGAMECIVSLAKTKEQRELLFTNYAVIWSEKILDTALFNQLENDEHSPSVIRVNAILAATNEFYETYDVKEGDGMYIAPENRISRWH